MSSNNKRTRLRKALPNTSLIVILLSTEYALTRFPSKVSSGKAMRARSSIGRALVLLVLFILPSVAMNVAMSQSGKIDVFTQKHPFAGRGPKAPSDAFHPGEKVWLYALVSYNDIPLQNALVMFQIEGPSNSTNISFHRVAETNETGLASVSFTIPSVNNESTIFGNWTVSGLVEISGVEFEDSLVFKVDWIVKIVSLRTVDEKLINQTSFGMGGDVGVEIAFRSISMIEKKAIIALVIQDEINVPVSFLKLDNIWVQPNETLVRMYCALNLPKWAVVGTATLYASVLTALPSLGGVPYCPAVSTSFYIAPEEPLDIKFHDVAVVRVASAPSAIDIGETVDLNVTVRNEGTETENFDVNIYFNSTLVETLSVESLTPYTQTRLNLRWNTSALTPGNYTISASIPLLSNETEVEDNTYIDGLIRVEMPEVIVNHDVAIVGIIASPSVVNAGSAVFVNVTVKNKGNQIETFNLSTYYNFTNLIKTLTIDSLLPDRERDVTFVWDTLGVSPGVYVVSGFAHPVVGEEEVSDNFLVGGNVTVLPPLVEVLHDVSVVNVTVSPSVVRVGGEVVVVVVVKNNGTEVETFNVTAYFDGDVISSFLVVSLVPGGELDVTFVWDTLGVSPGVYVVRAWATPVNGETNIEDNTLLDGTVEITSGISPMLIPNWLIYLIGFILVLLIILLIIALLHRRKRQKESRESFNRAWKAWYKYSSI